MHVVFHVQCSVQVRSLGDMDCSVGRAAFAFTGAPVDSIGKRRILSCVAAVRPASVALLTCATARGSLDLCVCACV